MKLTSVMFLSVYVFLVVTVVAGHIAALRASLLKRSQHPNLVTFDVDFD
jgi:hypothetical protein